MRKHRRKRLAAIIFVLIGISATTGLAIFALRENLNLFYEPARIVSGEAPLSRRIRGGGMVVDGSVIHDQEGLGVAFDLTDYRGSTFTVRYVGILPGLFREGQGILVTGQLGRDGVFVAEEVLAKPDEKYMPPELANMETSP